MAKNLQDSDLFLVNRGSDSYKATFADLKDSLTTPLVIGEIFIKDAAGNVVNPASNPPTIATGTQLTAEPQVSGGDAPYVNTFQWQRDGSNIAEATTSIYTVSTTDIGKALTCVVNSGDSADPQNTATKTSNATGLVEADAPDTPTLLSPVSGSSVDGNNFTMLASAFAPSSQTLKSTTFQISASSDFSSTVVNETVDGATNLTVLGKIDSGVMAYDTTYYARCLQTNTSDENSEYSVVNTFTTNEAPPDPTDVDVSGLKFDSTRQTQLSRSLTGVQAFTFSVWAKGTYDSDSNNYLFVMPSAVNSGDEIGLTINNGKWTWYYGTNSAVITDGQTNTWTHIVVSATNSTVKFYINGVDTGVTVPNNGSASGEYRVGARVVSGGQQWWEGYLSETYFVDNQTLNPQVFGKTINNGTWVPKNNTDIKAVIDAGPVSPYDERANTSAVWSSNLTALDASGTNIGFLSGRPATLAFDGDPDYYDGTNAQSGAQPNLTTGTGTQLVFTPATPIPAGNGTVAITGWKQQNYTYTITTTTGTITQEGEIRDTVGQGTTNIYNVTGNIIEIKQVFKGQLQEAAQSISGISIDGRLLVDSTLWDNTQQWSDGATGNFSTSFPVTNMFDGVVADTNRTAANTGSSAAVDFTNLTISSSLKIYCAGSIAGSLQATLGGSVVDVTFGSDYEWREVSLPSTPISFDKLYFDDGTPGVAAIEVDGSLLIDAGAQYNTSQNWIGNVSGSIYTGARDGYWTNAFDGNTDTRAFAPSADTYPATVTYNFDSTPINTSLRVWVGTGGNGTQGELIINGSDVTSQLSTGDITGKWVPITGFSSLTSVGVSRTAGSTYTALYAVEVDGKILVTPGFGLSGFYLPFDPDVTGTFYPDATNTIGTPALQTSGSNLFNGDLTEAGAVFSSNTSGAGINWQPTSNITGNISLFLRNGDIDNSTISWNNGGDWTVIDMSNRSKAANGGWYDIGNITIAAGTGLSLRHVTTAGSNTVDWRGIEVDDVMLVDRFSVGKDDSGNNNDFFTANFGIGNTSQTWSKDNTSAVGFYYSTSGYYGGPENAFNGSLDSYCLAGTAVDTYNNGVYAPSPTISFNTLKICVEQEGTGSLWLNTGSGLVDVTDDLVLNGNKGVYTTSTPGILTSLEYRSTTAGNYCALGLVEINGEALIDPSFLDTVLDTPVSNYSVAQLGTNGNLENTSNTNEGTGLSSLERNTANTYYAEFTLSGSGNATSNYSIGVSNSAPDEFYTIDGTGGTYVGNATGSNAGFTYTNGDVIGILWEGNGDQSSLTYYKNGVNVYTFSLGTSSSITNYIVNMNSNSSVSIFSNYGQQPFQYAINNNDGTAIVDPSANQSQVWSASLTGTDGGSFSADRGPALAFDGDLTTSAKVDPAGSPRGMSFAPSSPISFSQKIEAMTTGNDNIIAWNGHETVSGTAWRTIYAGSGEISASKPLTVTARTVNATLVAVRVDGRLLVNTGLWDQSQMWSSGSTETNPTYGSWETLFNGQSKSNSQYLQSPTGATTRCNWTGINSTQVELSGFANSDTAELLIYHAGGSFNCASLMPTSTNNQNYVTIPSDNFTAPITGISLTSTDAGNNCGLYGVKIGGEVLVDGQITADLLVEKISEQDGYSTLFYDENIGGVTRLLRLMNRYGFQGAKPGCGIYQLTEQPDFEVANYIKSGNYYVPTRSYSRLFKCLLKAVSVDWAATTAFTKDQIVEYNDLFYCVTADHTTGSSFATGNLHIIETAEAFATAFAPAGQTSSSY